MALVIGMGGYGVGMEWGGVLAPMAPAHRPQHTLSCPKPHVWSSWGGGKGWGGLRRGDSDPKKGQGGVGGPCTEPAPFRAPPALGGWLREPPSSGSVV